VDRKEQKCSCGRDVKPFFLLLMVFVCAMALAHPVWRHWYELIFPPLLAIMAVLALGYAMRK